MDFNFQISGNVPGGEVGLASIPNKEREFQQNLDLTVQFAKALNCKKYVLLLFFFPFFFIS